MVEGHEGLGGDEGRGAAAVGQEGRVVSSSSGLVWQELPRYALSRLITAPVSSTLEPFSTIPYSPSAAAASRALACWYACWSFSRALAAKSPLSHFLRSGSVGWKDC